MPKPTFTKGNKLAKGGDRPRSGRKSVAIKQAEQALFSELQFEVANRGPDGAIIKDAAGKASTRKATLIALAGEVYAQAMSDRDADGCVTPAGVRAAEQVHNRVYGKPRQAITIDSAGKNPIADAIALLADVDKGDIEDVFEPKKVKRATKRVPG